MKRAIVTLLVTALLGTLSPGLPSIAQPLKLPHENPATARETRIENDLLLTFSDVIDLAAANQYGSARDRLEGMRQANLPPDISRLVDEYGGLYQRLFTEMDDLERQLDDISSLLARNRTGEARQLLEAAGTAITEEQYLVKDTQAATESLDEKMSALTGLLPEDPLTDAYNRLRQNVGRLSGIVESFETLQQDLTARYAELSELTPVELSLEMDPAAAFVGDIVTASGRLGSGLRPLPGRNIALATGNNTLATAITAADGSYKIEIPIPYKYVDIISFLAAYAPTGDDAAIFLGAQSRPFSVTTAYYPSGLALSLPETVYPGQPFTIGVEITSDEVAAERTIIVTLDGKTLANTGLPPGDRFSLEITPPPNIPPGVQDLKVAVPAEGRHAGASEIRHINVAVMNVSVRAEIPSIILLPRTIPVRGSIHNGPGPVGGAPVDLNLNERRISTTTAPDGTFRADMPLKILPTAAPLAGNPFYLNAGSGTAPFNIWPVGWQDLEITAGVPGPSLETFELKKRVVSANPLTIGMMVAVLAAAWVFIYRRQRQAAPVPLGPRTAETVIPPPAEIIPAPPPRLTGLRGRVLAAYNTGLAAVERTTGTVMGPDITLREFLKMAPLPSTTAGTRFIELTGIAEDSLYSRDNPLPDTAARAEELADTIEEDLNVGTA